ncbi:hypothetical protein AA0242T_1936 [Acetobacter aceti NRIC 0242]|uniref:Uncharacterized protein n=1 Tax=Acetobacter aceti NBRC 14818 TaxID=887700 RepID=A0AB33IIU3_ACEAC|nr:hypothetical protein [Acetobacter aceti]TCS27517.1 hypothetical protein EDC15_12517 [Acetobacter aceti NBRC 14818]BCK75957.1 hypothetical protein EMQ_1563 [Acetobacter aceti NBRC 14818]GAN58855.1 hypothetical protein Abac_086_021 [Acetobacter aceti NBRC 14818]GBO81234.1 hypothetical protein AA0242T_1936 [Acetobacter aceti NRIC 0242]
MFIADASFIKGTKWKILENIAQRQDIGVSPITAIELASHLCESPKEQSYNRSKVNFLKCKLFKILDDPFWISAKRGIITAHNSRQHEASMVGRLFPIVESSGTLGDLLSKYIEFPEGCKVKCNIMEYSSTVLAEEENVFRKTVSQIWAKAPLDPLLNGGHTLHPDNFGRVVMNSIKDNHLSRKHSLAYIFGISMYFGYIMDRMIVYANKRPRGIGEFNYNMIDRNDCEDAFLCLNLNLNSTDTIVTNDKGTINAINNTVERILSSSLFSRAAKFVIREKKYVMNHDEFLSHCNV